MSAASDSALVLAVDIGGTKVEAALVDGDGGVRAGSTRRGPTGPDASFDDLVAVIVRVAGESVSTAPDGAVIIGVGIGSAGPIDLGNGTISPNNLPRLHGFAVRRELELLLPGCPATLRLDGTCTALAEHWLGATRGTGNSLSMVVSTGVGGGLILDGRLVSGRTGNAGHVGQIQIATRHPGADRDAATLEAIASGPRTVAWARELGWNGATGEDLATDAASGDRTALAAIRRSATAVGEAIASVSTLLDLEVVAIGGGFANVSDDYIGLVASAVRDSAMFDYARAVQVVPSALQGAGPLLGAAALVHRAELLGASPRVPATVG